MKAAQPFMLIVVQMGRTKRETRGGYLQTRFRRGEGDGQHPRAALGEERDGDGGRYLLEDADGIETAREEEEGDDEEELDEVAADDDGRVFPERADDDTRFDLRGELRRKREDAEGQHEEEGADQREEELLQAVERL